MARRSAGLSPGGVGTQARPVATASAAVPRRPAATAAHAWTTTGAARTAGDTTRTTAAAAAAHAYGRDATGNTHGTADIRRTAATCR